MAVLPYPYKRAHLMVLGKVQAWKNNLMSENCNLSRVLFVEGDEVKNETHLTSLFPERNTYLSIYITESAQRNWHAAPGVFASHGVPVRLGKLSRASHTLFRRCAFGVQSVSGSHLQATRRVNTRK